MKKASIQGLVIVGIVLFIIIKIIVPKFTSTAGEHIGIYAAASELETAINDIRQYYFKYGNLVDIRMMTSVQNFKDNSIRLERNKPVEYGVKDRDGVYNWCATLEVRDDDKIYVRSTGLNTPTCKEFVKQEKFLSSRETSLTYN